MTAVTIKSVGVAGSGLMGTGIAELAATSGFNVVLRGRSVGRAEAARDRMATSLAKVVRRGDMSEGERDVVVGRVVPTADLDDLASCDLVVETVVEDLDAKRALFAALDRSCGEATVLATNTSTLPVTELATATGRPGRVIGTHFFNPVPRMPLVEIVPTVDTSDETVAVALQFAAACGKQPVTVRDRAGFIVNALLFPYLNSAVEMLQRGTASKEDIDVAMRGGCGVPMGPFELLDLVGLDTGLAILNALHAEQGTAATRPSTLLEQMVADGLLGKKTGQGFYSY